MGLQLTFYWSSFSALRDYDSRVVAYTDQLLDAVDRQAQKGQKLNASKLFKYAIPGLGWFSSNIVILCYVNANRQQLLLVRYHGRPCIWSKLRYDEGWRRSLFPHDDTYKYGVDWDVQREFKTTEVEKSSSRALGFDRMWSG